MGDAVQRVMSVEDFLSWDDGTDTTYELHEGRVVAMAPPGRFHRILAGAMAGRIAAALSGGAAAGRGGCHLELDGAVRSDGLRRSLFVPDMLVSCAPIRPGDQITPDPVLIVEILSPSTEKVDRGVKLAAYRATASVQEILILDSRQIAAEVYRRTAQGWTSDLLVEAGAVLHLRTIGLSVPLGEIYGALTFDEAGPAADFVASPDGRD